MKTRFPNVTVDPDRHGKLRARWRKGERNVYLKALPDQPGFAAELAALEAGVAAQGAGEARHRPGTVAALCARYYASADFKARGGDDDRRRRRGLIESFRELVGDDLVSDFTFEHIEAILLARLAKQPGPRGRMVGGTVAAFNLRKALRRFFAFAKKLKWIDANPVEEAERVGRGKILGYHTASEAEIARYQARHPLGTRARLALEIVLWTGARRGDARLFGPGHVVGGKINFRTGKTGRDLWLPIARDLRAAIDAMPSVGIRTFLVTRSGDLFSKAGFGNKLREWFDEADLPLCTAHSLRKAIARRMAQLRLSDEGMMSVGGWRNSAELRIYTEAVDQEELADHAVASLEARYSVQQGGDLPNPQTPDLSNLSKNG